MRTLKARILVWNTVFLVALGVLMVGVAFWQMRASLLSTLNQEIHTLVQGQTRTLESWLQDKERVLTGIASQNEEGEIPLRDLKRAAAIGNYPAVFFAWPDGRSLFSDGWQAPASWVNSFSVRRASASSRQLDKGVWAGSRFTDVIAWVCQS